MIAAISEPLQLLQRLIALGAKVNITNKEGKKASDLTERDDVKQWLKRLEEGDEPAVALAKAITSNNIEDTKRIIHNHPDIVNSILDQDGRTPLTLAASLNKYQIIEYFMSIPGINFDMQDGNNNMTALMYAIKDTTKTHNPQFQFQLVKDLLSKMTSDGVSRPDSDKHTALWHAVNNNNGRYVEAILDSKKASASDVETALEYASQNNMREMTRLLMPPVSSLVTTIPALILLIM